MSRSRLISITDSTRVGLARRLATLLAQELGFTETKAGQVAIVATEAAGNIVKHAGKGEILIRKLSSGTAAGLEILAIDSGPGIKDISAALQDGYSTAGSPGTGLGAISRLSHFCDIYSEPGKGTVILSQIWSKRAAVPAGLQVGAVCVPRHEGEDCGDAWDLKPGDHLTVMVVDGLGHGPLAARAADEALKTFARSELVKPADLLQSLHGPLRSTRGASVAVMTLESGDQSLRFAGIGNISGTIIGPGLQRRSMVSHNGTLGHEITRIQEFTYPWPRPSTIILHSDGLLSRWDIDGYPGLLRRHPAIIAGVIYRDFQRGKDDVTVVVIGEAAVNAAAGA